MPPIQAQLDHVVLLLPYKDILEPPAWLTDNFVISEGGRHADNKTENRLILFADGSYLELIAFINDDPQNREGHWWDKPFGVVDFALTTTDESFGELAGVKERLSNTGTDISYTDPKDGGRLKPDGTNLQWRVTFPIGTPRGNVPFWCHDVTPRDRRVPLSESSTTHPSDVIGMSGVLIEVSESSLARFTNATAAILGQDLSSENQYEIHAVHQVANAKKPKIRIQANNHDGHKELALSLVLQSPRTLPTTHRKIGSGTVSLLFEQC